MRLAIFRNGSYGLVKRGSERLSEQELYYVPVSDDVHISALFFHFETGRNYTIPRLIILAIWVNLLLSFTAAANPPGCIQHDNYRAISLATFTATCCK